MVFNNAKLMSRSLLHQQHLKCGSFVYSATEREGANKVELKKIRRGTYISKCTACGKRNVK